MSQDDATARGEDTPVRFTDKRRIDPETGQVRPTEDAAQAGPDQHGPDAAGDAPASGSPGDPTGRRR